MKFNLISNESEYFKDGDSIIQVESCRLNSVYCNHPLKAINSNLLLARKFAEKKEYPKAFQEIKEAYISTLKISPDECKKCVEVFRKTIINSLDNTVVDLRKMTTGFMANKKYKTDLNKAEDLLSTLKAEDNEFLNNNDTPDL